MNPEKPINLATQNVPLTQTSPGVPPTQSSQTTQQTSFITAARVTAGATAVTAGTAAYVAYLEHLKLEKNITKQQQDGLGEVFDTCCKNPSYKTSHAIYKLQLCDATNDQIICCLKRVGRLDENTDYIIQEGRAVPFAKTYQQHKVVDLNNPKNVNVTRINKATESVMAMRAEGEKMVENASGDDKVLLNIQQEKVNVEASKAVGNLREAAVDMANPQIEDTSNSVNQQLASLDTVKFVVNERNTEAKTLLDERKSETSISPKSSITTNKKHVGSGSSKIASVGNPFYPKEQHKHYSVGQSGPAVPSSESPYLPLARGLFALSVVSGCLYLYLCYFSSKKDTKQRKERQQYFHEKQSIEEKEFSDIIIVLKKSNFLNILHKYKMQKITLKEAKNLLSANFGLKEHEVLSILNSV